MSKAGAGLGKALIGGLWFVLAFSPPPATAQSLPQPSAPTTSQSSDGSTISDQASEGPDLSAGDRPDTVEGDREGDRIFGVPPSPTIVERHQLVQPVTTKQTFRIAALESFDPHVFLIVGGMAGLAQLQNQQPSWGRGPSGYGKRYLTVFSDNTIGTMMTLAVVPTLVRQDPRYFELGRGSVWHRAAYAASRSVVTRSRSGSRQFNVSELGGDALAAGLSNAYHPPQERSLHDTLARLGIQLMWHTVSNEVKEFWPDIRRRLKRAQ